MKENSKEGYLTCPSCGQTIEESFNLCPFCGASVCKVCSGCGKEIKIHWTLCPYCGKPAYEPSSYIDKAEELLKTGEYDRALEYVGLGKELYRGNSELRDLEDRIQQQKRAAVYDALVSRGFDLEEKGNILSAIRLYESANKIQKKESLTKRIESLRLRLEEENRFKLVNEAKAYAETARGYEEKGKLGAAIRFYKKANERYGDEEIEGKISSLEEERHRKWRRYGNWTMAVSAAAIIITIALIVIFTLLGGVGEETQDIVEEQAEHETISEEADETIPASRATGAVFYAKNGDAYAYDVKENRNRMILKLGSIEIISASPLGDRIAFYKEGDSIPWITNIDGTGVRRLLDETALLEDHAGGVGAYGLKWSNDGSKIFFRTGGGSSGAMIYQANSDGTGIRRFNRVSYPVFAFSTWGGPVVCYTRETTTALGDWDYRLERIDSSGAVTRIEPYVTWNAFWLSHDGLKLAIVEGDYDKKQNLRVHYIDSVRSVMLNEVYDFSIEASWSPDDKFLAICFGEEESRSMQIYDIERGVITTILSDTDCWSPSWSK